MTPEQRETAHRDYLEKLFVEAARKEIDQAENVWRSLPFFSATLAFELTAAFQLRDHVRHLGGWLSWAELAVLAAFGLLVAGTLFYLWLSIRAQDWVIPRAETDILDDALAVERNFRNRGEPIDGEAIRRGLQDELLDRYAEAASDNRQINLRRSRHRESAARLLVFSLFVLLVLSVIDVIHTSATVGVDVDARSSAAEVRGGTPR